MKKALSALWIVIVALSCKTVENQDQHELAQSSEGVDPLATENLGLDVKGFWTKTSRGISEKVIKFFYDRPSEIQNLGLNFYPDRTLTTDDGVDLQISYYLPKNHANGGKFPAVIFVNPWGSSSNANQLSRLPQRLTKEGFIVLLLTARGFGKSGGEAAFASERDQKDVSLAIDWLENNTHVDTQNIGIVGISYGGGVGLMSVLRETRLKTAVGINAWSDFVDGGFLAGHGVNERAGRFLVDFGDLMKSRIREAYEVQQKLKDPATRADVAAWGLKRSPREFLSVYNQRKAPLYFVHTYNDAFFKPNAILDFYQRYEGPKKVSFFQGVHGTNMMFEGFAKQGAGDDVVDWFNYWLRGQTQKDIGVNTVDFAIRNKQSERSKIGPSREHVLYNNWSQDQFSLKTFYLSKQGGKATLLSGPSAAATETSLKTAPKLALFGGDQDGDLILEGLLGTPVRQNLGKIDPAHTAVYQSEELPQIKIRSISKLHVKAKTTSPNPQVTIYLFAQSKSGDAQLITQGSTTLVDVRGGRAEGDIDFHAIAYDLEAGSRLALVVDTRDWDFLFGPEQNNDINLLEGAGGSTLQVSFAP